MFWGTKMSRFSILCLVAIFFTVCATISADDAFLADDDMQATLMSNDFIFSHTPISSTFTLGELFYLDSVVVNLTDRAIDVRVKVAVYEDINKDNPILVLQDYSALAFPKAMLMMPVLKKLDLPIGEYLLKYEFIFDSKSWTTEKKQISIVEKQVE